MCVSKSMMRVSEPMLDMDMANYSEVLDPTYTTLEFDTMQILYNSNGELSFISKWKEKLSVMGDVKLSYLRWWLCVSLLEHEGLCFKIIHLSFYTFSQNLN